MLNAKKLKKDLEKLEKKQKELVALEAKISKLKREIQELEKPFKLLQQPQVTTTQTDAGANITITTKQKNPVGHTTTL